MRPITRSGKGIRNVSSPNSALAQLRGDLYLTGGQVGERHAVDWSGAAAHKPEVVLRPRNTADVAAMLRLCHAARQPLVVQGGMTGLSGGATPQAGEWALSLERINQVVELDQTAMTITVGAGVPLQAVQSAAEDAGLRLPLDLGARGSCNAGGVVSTNAGGNQVIQHGMARALVLGLTAVLADGTVIPAHNKLLKNNAGFDLKQLFIGSEGALGVVTEVTFRLFPQKPGRETALCALQSFPDVIALLRRMGERLEAISSFEVMWSDYYQSARQAIDAPDPIEGDYRFYVLLETEGADGPATAETFQTALFSALEEGLLHDAVIAQSRAEAAAFWAIRDGIGELIPQHPAAANFDIGVPIARMDRFVAELGAQLQGAYADCIMLVFGHIGDGNLHILASTGRVGDKAGIYDLAYKQVGAFQGTITSEHGVGVQKKKWLPLVRSEAEIALMRTLKKALDPQAILNRGRVV